MPRTRRLRSQRPVVCHVACGSTGGATEPQETRVRRDHQRRSTKRDTPQLMSFRRYRTQEVAGSSPASSTFESPLVRGFFLFEGRSRHWANRRLPRARGAARVTIWHNMAMARRQTLIQLDDARLAALDERAAASGRSRSDLVREAIDLLLGTGDAAAIDAAIVEGYARAPAPERDPWAFEGALAAIKAEPW
jgi:predicted transcriptional regulator